MTDEGAHLKAKMPRFLDDTEVPEPAKTLFHGMGVQRARRSQASPQEAAALADTTLQSEAEAPQALRETQGPLAHHTTILPRLEPDASGPRLVVDSRSRFEARQTLGEGGAGEVELVMDHDIHRLVAVKRLKENLHQPGLVMRFVDEVRTVGSLEHPNIIPIHDVGVDAQGHYYFVMKYAPGETLESVITKLREGDPEYHGRYTFEYRKSIFVEILKAMEFAHSKGVIHRDLKPANIQVGPYGEVMVMDWGIAKPIREQTPSPLVSQDAPGEAQPSSRELYRTRNDTLIGTPAYMSPEQVKGLNDRLDERTDTYSLSAIFYELLTLKHYLSPKDSLEAMLMGVLNERPVPAAFVKSVHQSAVPPEYSHVLNKGLAKDPALRFASVREMRDLLQRIDEGFIPIQCPVTFTKRLVHLNLHFINRSPFMGLAFLATTTLLLAGGVAFLIQLIL